MGKVVDFQEVAEARANEKKRAEILERYLNDDARLIITMFEKVEGNLEVLQRFCDKIKKSVREVCPELDLSGSQVRVNPQTGEFEIYEGTTVGVRKNVEEVLEEVFVAKKTETEVGQERIKTKTRLSYVYMRIQAVLNKLITNEKILDEVNKEATEAVAQLNLPPDGGGGTRLAA